MIRLTTLGPPSLTRDDEPALARRRKELGLLTYLARRSPRPVSRSRLAAMLWGETDETRSRRSLRQALSDLRDVIGGALVADQETVRVGPGVHLDVAEFEADVSAERWEDAIARWGGPFLDAFEDLGDEEWRSWIESERAALEAKLVACYRSAVAAAAAAGLHRAVIDHATQWLERFPHDEEAIARLISALLATHRRTEAESRLAAFAERLRRDLATEPSPKLAALLPAGLGPIGRPGIRGLVSADFVGRAEPMGRLVGRWEDARQGRGRSIVLEGDEATGKSRLLSEFARTLREQPGKAAVIEARAHGGSDLLRTLVGRLIETPGASATPPAVLAELGQLVPEVRERYPALPAPTGDARLGDHLRRLAAEVGSEQPVALLIDDAPLADPASRSAVAALLRDPPAGCLTVAAGRRPHWSAAIGAAGSDDLERIRLAPLGLAETKAMVASMAPFGEASLETLGAMAHQQTNGIPGQVTQVVTTLAERGAIAPDATGRWELAGPIGAPPVPSGVREMMELRLGELTATARALVEMAAVLGPETDPGTLEAASGLDSAAFQQSLGEALGRRLLRDAGGRLGFASEANRRAVYDALAPSRRATLHRLAGRTLATQGAAAEIVAGHRRLGGRDPARIRRIRWVVAAGGVGVATLGALWWGTRPRTEIAPGAGILLADVRNETADSTLHRPLYTAALVSLQQSGRFWVFGRSQFGPVLERMRRGDTTVSEALAVEVARRENLPVVAQLTVSGLDSAYLLTGRLIETRSGRDLRAVTTQAAGRGALLDAVDRVAGSLRRALGDLRTSVSTADSLPQVSTRSLDAVLAFTEGEWAWTRGDWVRARDSWLRAVELDSTFAMGYVSLANYAFVMANNPDMGQRYLATAQRLGDRLSERERLRLEYEVATRAGIIDRRLAIARSMADRFPSPNTLYQLATAYLQTDRCSEAIPLLRRVGTMAPRFTNAWINLATCHNALGALDSALANYAQAERVDSTALIRDNINHEWGQIFLKADRPAAAESAFRRILTRPEPNQRARGYRSLGYLALFRGRPADAIGLLDQAIILSRGAGAVVSTERNLVIAANAAITAGDTAGALRRLEEASQLVRAGSFESSYLEHLAAAYLRVGRLGPARTLHRQLAARLDSGTPIDRAHHRRLAARLALATGNPRQALGLLMEVPPPTSTGVALWESLKGDAYEALDRPDSALTAFQKARQAWNWGFEGQEEWVRASHRIGLLAEQLNDSALARSAYGELVERWRSGDSTLPELRWARRRLAQLQPAER
ncbi:MAG: AAA family ATPase [Gemmatimonadales bacterium]